MIHLRSGCLLGSPNFFKCTHNYDLSHENIYLCSIKSIQMENTFTTGSIFSMLSGQEKENLGRIISIQRFSRKATIFNEGATLPCVYMIHSGTVKVCIQGSTGKEHIVRMAGSGELIGYQSILTHNASSTTAIAMTNVTAYAISRQSFFSILKNNPPLTRELLSVLAHEIQNAQMRMYSIAYKSVPARIAESLLAMAKYYGYMYDGETINSPIYRKDLAEYAGVTIESAIRCLSKMNSEGIISLKNKNIALIKQKEILDLSTDE